MKKVEAEKEIPERHGIALHYFSRHRLRSSAECNHCSKRNSKRA